ncbi:MAG TPA: type II secretion system F family protein [Dongiaceae bacterium]
MLNNLHVDNLTLSVLTATGFLLLGLVWVALRMRQPNLRRVREIAAQQSLQRAGRVGRSHAVRSTSKGFMHRVVTSLKLVRTVRAQVLMQKLSTAGWRSGDALTMYLFSKVALPVIVPVLTLLWLSTTSIAWLGGWKRLALAAALALFGYFLPDIWVQNAAQKRQKKIQLALPDALDLMVTCAEAGLSLEALMKRVASEMVRSGPELADELGLACIEMEFLPDRRQALVNLADRTNLPSIRALVNALQQSSKFGTPLSQAMRVLASEFRDDRIVKAEEKAARLPVLLTVPMVLFILPPLIMVLVGPAVLRVADQFVSQH